MAQTEAINIPDVLKAYKKYENDLPSLPTSDASVALATLFAVFGVKGSIELTSVLINGISKKYNGTFEAGSKLADIEHRTLYTGVITPEFAHEPEELRNTYLSDVFKLKLDPENYPFERWLLEWAIKAASQDLDGAIYVAKKDDADKSITGVFDSFEEIIKADITAGKITVDLGNLYDPGAKITAANAGPKLLAMFRSANQKLKKAAKVEVRISQTMYEMYEDWYSATHDKLPNVDTSGQVVLEGTQGKARFVVHAEWPEQRIVMVVPDIMCYGTDSIEDMKKILPFSSGNPYLYTAYGKYNFGVQFRSIHKSVFLTSKVY